MRAVSHSRHQGAMLEAQNRRHRCAQEQPRVTDHNVFPRWRVRVAPSVRYSKCEDRMTMVKWQRIFNRITQVCQFWTQRCVWTPGWRSARRNCRAGRSQQALCTWSGWPRGPSWEQRCQGTWPQSCARVTCFMRHVDARASQGTQVTQHVWWPNLCVCNQ
jgi:hypothetical protein